MMTLPARNSRHHLYYSSHADPMENMLRAHTLKSKSSYNINQYPLVAPNQNNRVAGSRWTLAPAEAATLMQGKQDKKNNTYYNNMIMYINNKNGDNDSTMSAIKAKQNLAKSRESLYSQAMLKEPIRDSKEDSDDCGACRQCDSCCETCCCSFWSWVLIILFLMAGFIGGVLAGAIWQQNGVLREIGEKFPALNYITDYYSNSYNYYYNNRRNDYNRNNNNNYNNLPYPNPYNSYTGYYSGSGYGGYQQPNQNYDPNNRNNHNNDGRTRVILPGEAGGQPKSLGQGDNYYQRGQPMYGGGYEQRVMGPGQGQQGYDPRMMGAQGNQQGYDPRMFGPGGYDPRCPYRWNNFTSGYVHGSCALCAASKVLNVTGAGYADCSGLYSISNMTSIWDSKRVVFERVAGGWRPNDKRYIYWNAHFFGEGFYGWSIGDRQSLSESGPFHSQGRAGATTHPWQGRWKGNVSVTLVSCNIPRPTIRWNSQTMDELQRMREREREMNLMRNMQMNQPMDGGVYLNP